MLNRSVEDVAVLVATLEKSLASQLLAKLSPADSAQVQQAVARLGTIDPVRAQEVLAQFQQQFRRPPVPTAGGAPSHGGVVLEGGLAPLRATTAAVERPVATKPVTSDTRATGAEAEHPFRFLADADCPSLVAFLEKERPQTIALVLSYLPPPRAAQILAALSPRLQVDVVRRLADLEITDEESLRVVEHQLLEWMQQQKQHRTRRAAGLTAIAGILAAAGAAGQRRILENVEAQDVDLASRIGLAALPQSDRQQAAASQPRIVPFEDLAHLPGELLAKVVQSAEPELVVLAMAGASGRLVSQILSAMPRGAARTLRKRLDNLGPIRLGDVEAAQHELASLAAQAARAASSPASATFSTAAA